MIDLKIKRRPGGTAKRVLLAFLLLAVAAPASYPLIRKKKKLTSFKLVGGTGNLPFKCEGSMEVGTSALIFNCSARPVTIHFPSIVLMEYRSDLSRTVRQMKLNWVTRPGDLPKLFGHKQDRFFTVVYNSEGVHQAAVFEVLPEVMEPYLAEIELKTGKRVVVESFEQYE